MGFYVAEIYSSPLKKGLRLSAIDRQGVTSSITEVDMANDRFYQAFEERYRGSCALIQSRLQVYLPFLEPLNPLHAVPAVLDLGCGRGEWLELLQGRGFQVAGVDRDGAMVATCDAMKLPVVQGDLLEHLRSVPAESQAVVSAFHVAEHLSFAELQQLVAEALRVLAPGGLLILETPNPENLIVGATNFYQDPTHRRPVPAALLGFVVEHAGFGRVKTLYLNEDPNLAEDRQIGLLAVLGGVSPDYAVVAQKTASAEICRCFDLPFSRSYGVDLKTLAKRYDRQLGVRPGRPVRRFVRARKFWKSICAGVKAFWPFAEPRTGK
jgi:O-antigen chain-terminating methyltransferase